MNPLTPRELELVALGAALGSNCAPCVEHHVGEARKAGLGDAQIGAAIAAAEPCPCAGILATACAGR